MSRRISMAAAPDMRRRAKAGLFSRISFDMLKFSPLFLQPERGPASPQWLDERECEIINP
jgi:hypothetical protein